MIILQIFAMTIKNATKDDYYNQSIRIKPGGKFIAFQSSPMHMSALSLENLQFCCQVFPDSPCFVY